MRSVAGADSDPHLAQTVKDGRLSLASFDVKGPTGTSAPMHAYPSDSDVRFRERVRSRLGTADVLAFTLGGERYGFDVRAVDEVVDMPPLQFLTDRRHTLAGVCPYRGRILPVFLPSTLLGVCAPADGTVLVMRRGTRRVGLLVDDVDDVETVDLSTVRDAPPTAMDELLLGVVWRAPVLTALLDARAMIGACVFEDDAS